MCLGMRRVSPAQGVHFSIHLCDLSLNGSARASWLFPWHGQRLAGCRGEEPPLGVMPLGVGWGAKPCPTSHGVFMFWMAFRASFAGSCMSEPHVGFCVSPPS